jgi:hypothetical protein
MASDEHAESEARRVAGWGARLFGERDLSIQLCLGVRRLSGDIGPHIDSSSAQVQLFNEF